MRWKFGILLLLTGCGYRFPWAGDTYSGPTNPQPNQDQAVQIVWYDTYGIDAPPPPIIWKFGDRCDPTTPLNTFSDPKSGECLLGYYDPFSIDQYANTVFVEWNGNFSANQTFAHELCHARDQYMTGDSDINHHTECFSADGVEYTPGHDAPYSLASIATAALLATGL
jgi:hypothetical protein